MQGWFKHSETAIKFTVLLSVTNKTSRRSFPSSSKFTINLNFIKDNIIEHLTELGIQDNPGSQQYTDCKGSLRSFILLPP